MKIKTLLFACFLILEPLYGADPNEVRSPSAVKGDNSDRSIISLFFQPGISFIGFNDRDKFQAAIDTVYKEYMAAALTEAESSYVSKQDFQKVNFCFPLIAGIQIQWHRGHFISLGSGFIYDNESVVITDRKDNIHYYEYTLQGIPLFLEYKIDIPSNLISLSNGSVFSFSFRWYWMLPGTEIYSDWGCIKAKTDPLGNGFGASIGYLAASWKSIRIFGDIGYSFINVKSNEPFSGVVPDDSQKKAEWDLGGIELRFRFLFGVISRKKDAENDMRP